MITLHIVPNTGIQYVPLPSIDRRKARAFQQEFMQGASFARIRPFEARHQGAEYGDEDDSERDEGDEYKVASGSPAVVLDVVEDRDGMWIPIPVDRSGCWVCLFLKPDGDSAYKAVLALDTTLIQQGNPQGVDQEEDAVRSVAPCSRSFWSQPCVREYFVHLRRSMQPSIDRKRLRDVTETELQRAVIGLAGFLRTLDISIRLESCPSSDPSGPGPIGVDLAIDIGNSRTCVLMKESVVGEETRSQQLHLIYPSDPTHETGCPFSTQCAFVEHEILPSAVQSRESFHFLSLLQMGPSAASRLRHARFDPRPLGLSSPKRYLWDDSRSVDWEWSLSDRQNAQGRPEHLRGSVLARMDVDRPLKDPVIPPAVPNHPRLSCTVWTVIEILEQAFRQVNSISWRRADTNAPLSNRRREILNLVVTFPAGMHSREVSNFRKACERACKLWSEFRTNPHQFAGGSPVPKDSRYGIRPPAVHMVCDEGLSVQACWLYGMVVHTYGADVSGFLASLGRRRGKDQGNSLRLASIDVGGGTIDVSIAQYAEDPERAGHAGLSCRRIFSFGVSRAGDELVRGLLQRQVFLPIVRHSLGGDPGAWNRVICEAQPADVDYPILRRQCVRNLWMPTAMHALALVEGGGAASFELGQVPGIEIETLERLERELSKHGTVTAPLSTVKVELGQTDLRLIVKESIGRTLSQCADVIDQYACDVLVVGGRPSSLRAVREAVTNAMPVPPGQIFFLSEMPVEDWYPFIRPGGKITDAKTCGVFGGLVAFDALRGATTMSIAPDLEGGWTSKGPIMGVARSAGVQGPILLEAADEFSLSEVTDRQVGPLVGAVIVMRRINDPRAEASQVYEYRLKRDVRQRLDRNPVRTQPINAQFSIRSSSPERVPSSALIEMGCESGADVIEVRAHSPIHVGVDEQIEAGQAMELVFKTMSETEGHWIDTGHFQMLVREDI